MKPDPTNSLFDDLFRPLIWLVLKIVFFAGLITLVWVCAGIYERTQLRVEVMDAVDARVLSECQRPDWVRTKMDAREYDVTVMKLDVVNDRMDMLVKRTKDIKNKAEQVEELRMDMLQARAKPTTLKSPAMMSWMGGPGPKSGKSKLDRAEAPVDAGH